MLVHSLPLAEYLPAQMTKTRIHQLCSNDYKRNTDTNTRSFCINNQNNQIKFNILTIKQEVLNVVYTDVAEPAKHLDVVTSQY